LFRDSCTITSEGFIKDLSQIGRQLKDMILLDNTPLAYSLQQINGLPIKTWIDDKEDTQLKDLLPVLKLLSKAYDVRDYLKKIVKEDKVDCESAVQLLKAELGTMKPIEHGIRVINRWIAQQEEKVSSKIPRKTHISEKSFRVAMRPEINVIRKPSTAQEVNKQNPGRYIRELTSENIIIKDIELNSKLQIHREISCNRGLKEGESVPAISNFKNTQRNVVPKKKIGSVMMNHCTLNLIPSITETSEEAYNKRNIKLYDTISKDFSPKTNFNRKRFMVKRVTNLDLIDKDKKNPRVSLQNEELYSSIQTEYKKNPVTSTNKETYSWDSTSNQSNDNVPILETKQPMETPSNRYSLLSKGIRFYKVSTSRDSNLKIN